MLPPDDVGTFRYLKSGGQFRRGGDASSGASSTSASQVKLIWSARGNPGLAIEVFRTKDDEEVVNAALNQVETEFIVVVKMKSGWGGGGAAVGWMLVFWLT